MILPNEISNKPCLELLTRDSHIDDTGIPGTGTGNLIQDTNYEEQSSFTALLVPGTDTGTKAIFSTDMGTVPTKFQILLENTLMMYHKQ